jgi:cation diffusion facilitator family transporter
MHHSLAAMPCSVRTPIDEHQRERGVRAVVLLTFVMMLVEIVVGHLTGSMALLADGWHMATHVAALGLASAAYALSRRFAAHRAFGFGTGKIQALAGYTSAVALGLVALMMVVESASRLLEPVAIDFDSSLPVAVLGLIVNVASFRLLHGGSHEAHEHDADDDHHEHDAVDHGHEHDHNHRAALLHVAADALTSLLAIVALLAGKFDGFIWLDPIMGIIGGLIIVKWGASLCKHAAFDLLDVELSPHLEDGIRSALEHIDDVRVSDLHVWSLGRGARGCVVTLVSGAPREIGYYREQLARFGLTHLTLEVRRCTDGHTSPQPECGAPLRVGA